jgi:hypothetical protein
MGISNFLRSTCARPQRQPLQSGENSRGGAYNRDMGETIRSQAQTAKGEFSLGGALGARAGKTYRLLRGTPGRNKRLLRGVQAGVTGFAAPMRKVLHVLFLEVSGLVFLFISLGVVSAFLREYRKYAMHEVGVERIIVTAALGAMFLYFAVSSFWRARRRRFKA